MFGFGVFQPFLQITPRAEAHGVGCKNGWGITVHDLRPPARMGLYPFQQEKLRRNPEKFEEIRKNQNARSRSCPRRPQQSGEFRPPGPPVPRGLEASKSTNPPGILSLKDLVLSTGPQPLLPFSIQAAAFHSLLIGPHVKSTIGRTCRQITPRAEARGVECKNGWG